MKSSARNQFDATITGLRAGAVNDEVELSLASGRKLVAVITRESAAALDLKTGMAAVALIKSSAIIVVTDDQGVQFSARNHFAGTVVALTEGAVNSEVTIAVPDVGQFVAMVTNASRDGLALQPGQHASVLFKASSVIVGVRR
ncbi:molybdopterin-binding protein [Paludibacterium sp. B53371]|uniref:TOBE domain-containing protein n=1 Tax=Paludibacterium sp. B53371 TaxID=2806263 RepID=UPI001C053310|nr:TOBE domain-containing protein [Paludibacterium sp. B53371]